jgi:fumarate hydratase subunit alpha
LREIDISEIIETVKALSMEANYNLSQDIHHRLEEALEEERLPLPKDILAKILENAEIAQREQVPMCQDTGMACVFLEIGQEVHITGGSLEEAINEGIRRGYQEGYLRKSVVKDPIFRENTKDNTPAIIYYNIKPGDKLKIIVAPKGFGSENMSQIRMLKPSEGIEGVKDFVLKVVREAGSNPCPPIVVGVGIGGTFDKAAFLAKKALLRPINQRNENHYYADLEKEMLETINKTNIGPQGFGGITTALAVNIETFPTHIAGLPVAVNINCHASRHLEREI